MKFLLIRWFYNLQEVQLKANGRYSSGRVTCQRIHLVSRVSFKTDHNGNKLNSMGQLFTTTEENDHAVNEGFFLLGTRMSLQIWHS